jgi:hypothetical protein
MGSAVQRLPEGSLLSLQRQRKELGHVRQLHEVQRSRWQPVREAPVAAMRLVIVDIPDTLRPPWQPPLRYIVGTAAAQASHEGLVEVPYDWRNNGGAIAVFHEAEADVISPPDVAVAVVQFTSQIRDGQPRFETRIDYELFVVDVSDIAPSVESITAWLRRIASPTER